MFERDAHPDVALTTRFGMSIFEQAKSAEILYSEVRRRAERLWPLWA